jgi:hypothetical protein
MLAFLVLLGYPIKRQLGYNTGQGDYPLVGLQGATPLRIRLQKEIFDFVIR